MSIAAFDHVAIPTAQPEEMLLFYRALGFSAPTPEQWRASGAPYFSLHLGQQKINVHAPALWQGGTFTLRGPSALPGCGDFCFVWSGDAAYSSNPATAYSIKSEPGVTVLTEIKANSEIWVKY